MATVNLLIPAGLRGQRSLLETRGREPRDGPRRAVRSSSEPDLLQKTPLDLPRPGDPARGALGQMATALNVQGMKQSYTLGGFDSRELSEDDVEGAGSHPSGRFAGSRVAWTPTRDGKHGAEEHAAQKSPPSSTVTRRITRSHRDGSEPSGPFGRTRAAGEPTPSSTWRTKRAASS